jgi:DNA-directed RNA polymerase specialized sigma24 family protein
MGQDGDTSDGGDELLKLIRDKYLVGLSAQIYGVFPNAGTAAVADAIGEAVKAIVIRLRKGKRIADVKAYLASTAYNELKRAAKRAARREVPLDQRPEEFSESAENVVLRDAAVQIVKAEIRTWENVNIREVMLVYVDAIALGEPIESEEVAEIVSPILGEEISAATVRVWKTRGFRKLRDFAERSELKESRR